jgi:hypothetical protein
MIFFYGKLPPMDVQSILEMQYLAACAPVSFNVYHPHLIFDVEGLPTDTEQALLLEPGNVAEKPLGSKKPWYHFLAAVGARRHADGIVRVAY